MYFAPSGQSHFHSFVPAIEMEVAKEDGILAPPREMASKIIDYLEAKGLLKAD